MRTYADHKSPLVQKGRVSRPLTDLVDDYLIDGRARGLSPRTVEAYEVRLYKVLLPFCERQGITSVGQLDRAAVNQLSLSLQTVGPGGKPLSRASVNSYLNTVNIWLNWCERSEGEAAPARAHLPKVGRKTLDVLSKAEIGHLEQEAETERDKLIVRVLADSGIRAGELLGLRVQDLVRKHGYRFLHVHGKGQGGGKERMVPIGDAVFRRLERLARGRGPEEHVFRTLRKRGEDYEPMGIDALEGMLRTLRLKTGMKKRLYAHLFRHSFATRALRGRMSTIQLREILGHSSLRMIDEVYSHLNADDAAEAMRRFLESEQ